MPQSRRKLLQGLNAHETTHAGLWLDKYIDLSETKITPQAKLVQEVSESIKVSDVYQSFFDQWKQALENTGAKYEEGQVQGRLAINLGAESILETSIALHRTYGTPYLPGSALKGLSAHYTQNHLDQNQWSKDEPAFRVLFGDENNAGFVTFFDALFVPGSGYQQKALWPDIITVHHPEYYQASSNPPPPTDWDSPTPIPFLSATGRYLIALAGPDEWVKTAFEILNLALKNDGIGAKTSSGYGRIIFGGTTRPTSSYAEEKRDLLGEIPPSPRIRGTVAGVDGSGRYGYINPARGGARMFVHISQITEGEGRLVEGLVVEYQLGKHKGRDQAQNVHILLEPR